MIDINEYLSVFPGENPIEKIGKTELNKIILNSIPNVWGRQVYMQGFYCETINFEISVIMFEPI